ncbi:hypothetical protein IMZ48_26510 [Candidatus Bathyarchaeota archaeon]|nr:hypothetical protein [Candidatus Bathyarchaeota archaeon]
MEGQGNGVHLGMLSGVLSGLVGLLKKVHWAAKASAVYEGLPELHKEVDDVIRAVARLVKKVREAG